MVKVYLAANSALWRAWKEFNLMTRIHLSGARRTDGVWLPGLVAGFTSYRFERVY